MPTERYTIGPFAFTFRNGRMWWSYRNRAYGRTVAASGATSISLAEKVQAFCQNPESAWAGDGLTTFARFCIADMPGAVHWADHYTRAHIRASRAA